MSNIDFYKYFICRFNVQIKDTHYNNNNFQMHKYIFDINYNNKYYYNSLFLN